MVTIIDKNGYIITSCKLETDVKENEIGVQICNNYSLVKPRWNGIEWIETATQEEIKEWQEANKPVVPQLTQDEILRAKLIKDNANIQLQLVQQQKINASLLSQIAKLGGMK